VNTSSTRQSCVRYFQLEVVWLTHSVSSKSCLSQIPGVPLHTHFEGLPDRPYRSTQVFFEHAQIKFGQAPKTRWLHQLPYLPCSVWLYMSTFKIFQALPQGHGDNEFNPIGHSQMHLLQAATKAAAASCKSHNLIVLSHAPLSALPVKTRFALRTCWNGTFHFLHLLEASAQFTLNQEFVKTAHDCTQLRARECACVVSMLV
jgi:hypothetical protein